MSNALVLQITSTNAVEICGINVLYRYESRRYAVNTEEIAGPSDIKSNANLVRFQRLSKSDRIRHSTDVPGGRICMGKRTLAEPRAQSW